MVNSGEGKSSWSLITIVVIVFLAGLVFGGLGGYLVGRRAADDAKPTVERPTSDKVLPAPPALDKPLAKPPDLSESIDRAKWSEGRAMMGSISTAIRAYHAHVGPAGPKPTTLYVSETGIGFKRGDLMGRYFRDEDFSFEVTSMDPLKFSITCVAGKSGISEAPSSPPAYTLTEDGVFKPQ